MSLTDTLFRARESFHRKEHRVAGLLDESGLLFDAAQGDAKVALDAAMLLDQVAGGDGEFSRFVDGGEFVSDGDKVGWVYRYDRSDSEISALLGKAILLAERLQGE